MTNEFGYEEEASDGNIYGLQQDDYAGGSDSGDRYVAVQWFTGIKTYLIDDRDEYVLSDDGEKRAAKGMSIPLQWAKNDDLLMEIINRLHKENKLVVQTIEHDGKKEREKYAFLNDWSFIPISLNAIGHKTAVTKPHMLSGYATGVTIDEETAYKNTYTSMLIVSKTLYEAGYVDDAGSPKALLYSMKGYNSGNENDIMQLAVKRQMVYRSFDVEGINGLRGKKDGKVVRGGEELFEYWIRLGISTKRKDRGSDEKKKTACFEAVDLDANPATWTPELEKKQHIGIDLYKKVFPMVYDVIDGKRVPGGISRAHSLKTLARHSEICRTLDPENELRMGKNDVPPQWKISSEIRKNNALKQAVQGDPMISPMEAAVKKYQNVIDTYASLFTGDDEGMRLVGIAQNALSDSAPGRAKRVSEAIQQIKDYEDANDFSDF